MESLPSSIRQSVGELFSLSQHKTSNFVTLSIPEEIRDAVCRQIGVDFEVRLHFGLTSIHGIVEAVRNHVLDWTLKLEKAGIRGEGLSFTQEETRVAHGSNTITGISQTNLSATPQEIAEAVGALIKAIQAQGKPSETAEEASDELAAAESELKAGRVPCGRISKALSLLQKGEDIALRPPQVMDHLQHLGKMLGLS